MPPRPVLCRPCVIFSFRRRERIRTKTRLLSTGAPRGGIPFGRGALYYLLSNHFYIGEVKYKNEILPGEQPPIMDRALFDAVRQRSLDQWSHRTVDFDVQVFNKTSRAQTDDPPPSHRTGPITEPGTEIYDAETGAKTPPYRLAETNPE